MPGYDIITIGASAGGVEALGTLVAGLSIDMRASVFVTQAKSLEVALWTAPRALEERAALANRTADRFRAMGREGTALRFDAQAREAKERSAVIRQVLVQKDLNAEMPRDPTPEGGPG